MREKDAEIERLRQKAQDLEVKLDSFADGILERDREINRLNEEIGRWQARLEDAAGRLAQYEAEKLSNTATGDSVNHPSHYNAGSIECIDAIEAATTGLIGGDAFNTGSAIKYLWRWARKGGVEDLRKARWYIDRLIGEFEVNSDAS
ncbi:MAG: DUF3310 domain-containing protein [Brevibacillus sp.]|nr:DUF3310 domain-containing protein [Brevibacillus sp.]